VVAYIFGNIPITREDLGEYLIARFGQEKIDLLINKKILDHICQQKGIEVTSAEIEADLALTLGELHVDRQDFLEKVLKARHLTLYEWKEDVVRPKLLLNKLGRDRVKVEEKDIEEAFESHYGEKIDAQVIIYPPGTADHVKMKVYENIRKSDDEFNREARQQADANLARAEGHIKPICRHTGLEAVEKAAFALQPGEVSSEIETPQGIIIIKCVGRIPPDKTKSIDKEREELRKEVAEKKMVQMVRPLWEELRAQAKPLSLMKPSLSSEADLKRAAETEINELKNDGKAAVPHGN
jgi:hypothetical protein